MVLTALGTSAGLAVRATRQNVGSSIVAADNGATKGLSNGIPEEGGEVRLLFEV